MLQSSRKRHRAAEATRKAQEAERAPTPTRATKRLRGAINALTWQLDKAREELAATNTKRAQIEKALADFNERIKNGTPTERKAFNFIDGKLSEIRNERAKQYIERKGLSKEFDYFVSHSGQLPRLDGLRENLHKNKDFER